MTVEADIWIETWKACGYLGEENSRQKEWKVIKSEYRSVLGLSTSSAMKQADLELIILAVSQFCVLSYLSKVVPVAN